jgi:hypothetical protein
MRIFDSGPNWQIESLAALPNPSYLTQLVLRNCDKFRLYDGSLEYYFPKLETVHFIVRKFEYYLRGIYLLFYRAVLE